VSRADVPAHEGSSAFAVTGRVVDIEARPIAGATVLASAVRGTSIDSLGAARVTDADGRFELEVGETLGWTVLVRENTSLRLRADAGGYWPVTIDPSIVEPWRRGGEPRVDVGDLVLEVPVVSVAGRIVDATGKPIRRASVSEVGGFPLAESDEDGGFRFRHERRGRFELTATEWSTGFAAFSVDTTTEPHVDVGEIVLRAADVIEGRLVLADGTPAGEVPVQLGFGEDPQWEIPLSFGIPRTEKDGSFRFALHPASRPPTAVHVLNLLGLAQTFSLEDVARGHLVVDGQHVTIHVTDPDGVAVPASLRLFLWQAESRPDPNELLEIRRGERMMPKRPLGAGGVIGPTLADGRLVGVLPVGALLCASLSVQGATPAGVLHEAQPGVLRAEVPLVVQHDGPSGRVRIRVEDGNGAEARSLHVNALNRFGDRIASFHAPTDLVDGASPPLPAGPLFFEIDPDPSDNELLAFSGDPLTARCEVRAGETVEVVVPCDAFGVVRTVLELADPAIGDDVLAQLRVTVSTRGVDPISLDPAYRLLEGGGLSLGRMPLQIREGPVFERARVPAGTAHVEVDLPGFAIQRRSVEVRAFEETIVRFRIGE
jgi:hypothetical protein